MGCFCHKKKIKQRELVEIPVASESNGAAALAVAKGEGRSLVFIGNTEEMFDLEDLLVASEILGTGTFGTCYKANIEIGPTMVFKRLKDLKVSDAKLVEMFDTIGKINHQNLLPLKAYYCSNDEKLLVYDYMPMRSLYSLLKRIRYENYLLKWDTRISIALGVARAIAHLHSQGPTMFHGNIKPSNILLSRYLEARVSDFLLDLIAGPFPCYLHNAGYCAPEITYTGTLSQEGDVYSFGVVLLELLTGKTPMWRDNSMFEDVYLPEWILYVVENELTSEVYDFRLFEHENVEEDLVRLLQIAIACTAQDPFSRPTMEEVKSQIEELCRASSQVRNMHIDGPSVAK